VLPPGTTAEGDERRLLEARFAAFEMPEGGVMKCCLACGWQTRYLGPQRMLEHLQAPWELRPEKEKKTPGRRRHAGACPYGLRAGERLVLKRAIAAARERPGMRSRAPA